MDMVSCELFFCRDFEEESSNGLLNYEYNTVGLVLSGPVPVRSSGMMMEVAAKAMDAVDERYGSCLAILLDNLSR